jgi:hypothetical protein
MGRAIAAVSILDIASSSRSIGQGLKKQIFHLSFDIYHLSFRTWLLEFLFVGIPPGQKRSRGLKRQMINVK